MRSAPAATLALLLLCAAPAAALAQSPPGAGAPESRSQASVMSLSAYGETRAAPDLATVTLGVNTHAPAAADALRQNASAMSALLAALKRGGIASADVQTTAITLSAEYAYDQGQPPRLTGYAASNGVAVTVRDLPRLGAVIDAATAAGGNQVSGVAFGLKDPQAAEDAARVEAVRRLQSKAELYARALGKRIVRLQAFSEGGGESAPAPMIMSVRMAKAAAPTPTTPGELTLRVEVQGVYEVQP